MAKEGWCPHAKLPSECDEGCNPKHPGWIAKQLKAKAAENKMTKNLKEEQARREELKKFHRRQKWRKKDK